MPNQLKILFLCRLAPGLHGVQRQWTYFFRHFAQTEFIPFCLLTRIGFLGDYLREQGVPFKVIPWRFASRGINLSVFVSRVINGIAFYRIARIARRFHPDIIEGDINDYSLLRFLSKKTEAAIVCRVRSHSVYQCDLRDCAFIDKFIPLSRRLAEPLLRAGVPATKIEMVNDGVDVNYFAADDGEKPAAANSELRVGIVGRIEPFKRILECLKVAQKLKAGGTPFSFVFIGGCYRPEYFKEVVTLRATLGLEEVCHFVPESEDMREFYRSIDVLLTLSGGSVMLEAMAMGKPVVAAAPVSRSEHAIVKHEETGLLYDIDDLTGVADGLRSLAQSPEQGRALGKIGRENAVQSFDIEELIRRTLSIYQSVIA